MKGKPKSRKSIKGQKWAKILKKKRKMWDKFNRALDEQMLSAVERDNS